MKLRTLVLVGLGIVCATICPAQAQEKFTPTIPFAKAKPSPRYVVDLKLRQQYPFSTSDPVLCLRRCHQISTCLDANTSVFFGPKGPKNLVDDIVEDGSGIAVTAAEGGRVQITFTDQRSYPIIDSDGFELTRKERIKITRTVRIGEEVKLKWDEPGNDDVYSIELKIEAVDPLSAAR